MGHIPYAEKREWKFVGWLCFDACVLWMQSIFEKHKIIIGNKKVIY